MKIKDYKNVNYVFTFFLIILLWQVISIILKNPIFPDPIRIIINLFEIIRKELLLHIIFSLKRIILGILLTIFIGVPLGIVMGYFPFLDRILTPFVYFGYPVPKMTLLPIVMLIFGLNDLNKIIMIFLIIVFPIIVNIRDEVKSIPDEIYYSVYSIGASKIQILKEIILPGVVPTILTSIRIGIGTAISVLFFTESFGTQYGMGYFIMDSYMRINYLDMYGGIIVLSIVGLIFFITIDILENTICPWK